METKRGAKGAQGAQGAKGVPTPEQLENFKLRHLVWEMKEILEWVLTDPGDVDLATAKYWMDRSILATQKVELYFRSHPDDLPRTRA